MPSVEMTQLDAVNLALSLIGQTPVSTLGSGENALTTMAENILAEVDRESQAQGWWFNSETAVVYTPNASDEIELGTDIFHVDSSLGGSSRTGRTIGRANDDFVKRGRKLYNLKDQTFTFTSDVDLDIIKYLEWNDLPTLFRNYVAKKTGRLLVTRYLADPLLISEAEKEEFMAWNKMVFENSRQSDRNFLTDNPIRHASLNYGGRGAIERGLI